MANIVLDAALFKKTAKRLQKELNQESYNLSKVEEGLAKAFGFRNYHGINEFFNKRLGIKKPKSFLENCSGDEIAQLCGFFISVRSGDLWVKRAVYLLSITSTALVYLSQNKEMILSSSIIEEYLTLDNIIKLSLRQDLPIRIKQPLRAYLTSLPGFLESSEKQDLVVREQHSYSELQLTGFMKFLKWLEENDSVIISPDWFEIKKRELCTSKIIYNKNTKIQLDDSKIKEIYQAFTSEEWRKNYDKPIVDALDDECSVEWKNIYHQVSVVDSIFNNEIYEDSWLSTGDFKDLKQSLLKSKQFKTYYFSELLLHLIRTANEERKTVFMYFLSPLMRNYEVIPDYSKKLSELAKN